MSLLRRIFRNWGLPRILRKRTQDTDALVRGWQADPRLSQVITPRTVVAVVMKGMVFHGKTVFEWEREFSAIPILVKSDIHDQLDELHDLKVTIEDVVEDKGGQKFFADFPLNRKPVKTYKAICVSRKG